MATATPTVDDQVLDALDFDADLPCEANAHERLGNTGAAEWIVTGQPRCGCGPWKALCCDACLYYGLSLTEVCEWVHNRCGRRFTCSYADTLVATERIR